MIDFNTLAQQCAPGVHPVTLQAVVRTESGFNPYAIGVVGGRLEHQPRNRDEAVATARALEASGWNYSMGLSQVNRSNLVRYGLDTTSVFDPCANLRAGAAILSDCYARASARTGAGQAALQAAFSCYYSGNFQRGFQRDGNGTSYVQRVVANTAFPVSAVGNASAQPVPVVPDVSPSRKSARPSPARDAAVLPQGSLSATPDHEPVHAGWDTFGDF
ncbi:lytic transglycosylase domain-containing protein [Paraburkholderia aspalathi]|nr:lytic transglycosylase domain-containing protein [Paraburkholderia aspalathi]MBK3786064.1 lytic transglycosylase domain-containing protein [Paraburkholderia aspalathi]